MDEEEYYFSFSNFIKGLHSYLVIVYVLIGSIFGIWSKEDILNEYILEKEKSILKSEINKL